MTQCDKSPTKRSPAVSRLVVVGAWQGDLMALVAGALATLAFSPFDAVFLAPLSLAVLFLLWLDVTPPRAAWRGWIFGLGLFGFGVSWVHESFQFSQVALPLAIVLTALLVVYLAVFPAVLGYLLVRFSTGSSWLRVVALFPAAWVISEWVRGWFLTGFTWVQLGYSQLGWPLAGLAPTLGVYGVSWAVAISAGLLVMAIRSGRRPRMRYLGTLAALWGLAWATSLITWSEVSGPSTPVALIQGNVPQHLKWLPEQRELTLSRYVSMTRRHWDAALVVWPETAVPAYYHQAADFLAELRREALAHGAELLVGLPVKEAEGSRYFNSVIALGERQDAYHKRHLVPFGEYIPLKGLLGPLLDLMRVPMSDFSAGSEKQPLLQAAGHKIGVSICYEDTFGEELIDGLPEATLLVNVSNDAWFGESIAPHQHLQMARMRALETGRYLLRATNTGISAIIGPAGALLVSAPQFEAHVLSGEVFPMRGSTPYVRFGNLPTVLLLLVVTGLGAAFTRPRG